MKENIIKYNSFNESKTSQSNKSIIFELCVSMILLNPEFLDNILDRGSKSRYMENSQIFLTDLKNLLLAKNRLVIGKIVDNKCIEDNEISKVNYVFNDVDFSIERDWNTLINSRIMARNIFDKLLPTQKLESTSIRKVYWLTPNKDKDIIEDIVIELSDGKQFNIVLNKNVESSKNASFNRFADDIIGEEIDSFYKDNNLDKWNKLTQTWVKLVFENGNDFVKNSISKFISTDRIESIQYFDYFNIRHMDRSYQHLGENFKELGKNILLFSDLMNEIWKKRDSLINNLDDVYKRWKEAKILLLNSKLIEYLFTNSLVKNYKKDIKKLDNGFKITKGILKRKLIKTIVEKLGCIERRLYYFGSNGNQLNILPERQYFRDNITNFQILFDYHVKLVVDNIDDSNNDFIFKIIMKKDNVEFIDLDINIKFSSGEFNNKLSCKYNFKLSNDYNKIINPYNEEY